MVTLGTEHYHAAFELYRNAGSFFPLIGAVLEQSQDGVVLADRAERPTQVYVEHRFGFAQIFGEPSPTFEAGLQRYLLVDKRFSVPKVRLFTPHWPDFLKQSQWESLRSTRQRFLLASGRSKEPSLRLQAADARLTHARIDASNVDEVEKTFGLVTRFWRTPADFIERSHGVLALHEGQLAGICYAAAVSNRMAEIDVMTDPAWRRLGVGAFTVAHFVAGCQEHGLRPVWDCFLNNTASMQLSRASGFTPSGAPYPFYTINK